MSGACGGASRGPRACPRAWAVLIAVLAALVHVLGCAHGPVSAAPSAGVPAGRAVLASQPFEGQPSAGQPSAGQPSAAQPALPVAGCAGRASHGAASCADADEPSVLPQRTDASAAPPADRTLAADSAVRDMVAPPAYPVHACAPAGADPDHRRRAALGVWRN
ncbi:hypothetical protein ACIBJC_07580 [Streptomyces sp. NPDC050509]|uniref:hypothetical protein n=1 Tax=Streptomyces sp. NPDC050509 TaxID=3365620 RepID=UPI00379CD7AC